MKYNVVVGFMGGWHSRNSISLLSALWIWCRYRMDPKVVSIYMTGEHNEKKFLSWSVDEVYEVTAESEDEFVLIECSRKGEAEREAERLKLDPKYSNVNIKSHNNF